MYQKGDRKVQKVGYLLFLLGAGGMDSSNMAVPAIMAFCVLGIIGITAWRERRKEQYDTASIKSQRHSRNVPDIRKQGIHHNKAA